MALVAVVVVLTVVLLAVVYSGAASRHTAVRRIESSLVLLGDDGESTHRGGIDPSLSRLERAAETIALRMDVAQADVDRMRKALEVLPQGVVVCDPSGIEVFRNEVAEVFSVARHGEMRVEHAVQKALAAALGGTPQGRELDVDGPPPRMLVVTAVPLEHNGYSAGALAIIDDVSERRRLEAVRRDFVANLSHELKTPVGALGLLAETIAAEDDPTVNRRLAERMTGEAARVGRLIEDLLALSRIEADERPVREPVSVRAIVDEAIERISSLAGLRHISVVSDAVGAGETVQGDRRQLVSAVANLLENACTYSDEGSSVRVACEQEGPWVEIAVGDQGIGIPANDLERVFERFYRVDRARARSTGGTGLGLAIVRHVVRNHGGEVRVESRRGVGSTFTLRLPS